mmetsp:Transcript_9427/g.15405  ORF Transcript_9427/g.15405 Transcript_9427/m.15405 type:complete len:90 (-) Transcript_9427:702-971(-)
MSAPLPTTTFPGARSIMRANTILAFIKPAAVFPVVQRGCTSETAPSGSETAPGYHGSQLLAPQQHATIDTPSFKTLCAVLVMIVIPVWF